MTRTDLPDGPIRHCVRKYDVACLKRQVFFHLHPVERMLRNHG